MVVISRIIRLSLLGSLLVTSCSPLWGMQSVARLLSRARMAKPALSPKRPLSYKPQTAFKPTYTQPKTFPHKATQKVATPPQPQTWWQRFTSWTRAWQMPRFNFFKSVPRTPTFGAQRVLSLVGTPATALAATAIQAQREVPEFTIENIDAYPEYREEFLAHIKEHPDYFAVGAKPEITAAVIHFLNKYPYLVYSVASIVVDHLAHVDTGILDLVLQKIKTDHEKDGNAFAKMELDKFSEEARVLIYNVKSYMNLTVNNNSKNVDLKNIDRVINYIPKAAKDIADVVFDRLYEINHDYEVEKYLAIVSHLPSLIPTMLKLMLESDSYRYWRRADEIFTNNIMRKNIAVYFEQNSQITYTLTATSFDSLTYNLEYANYRLSNRYARAFLPHSLHPELKGLLNILVANVFRPEILDKANYLYYILSYHNDPEFTQALLKHALEGENRILNSFFNYTSLYRCSHEYLLDYVTKGRSCKEAILSKVIHNPSLLATIPVANALLIYPHVQHIPEIATVMKKRTITQKEFEQATPNQLKALLRDNPSRADTFIQYALQTNNQTLVDILRNPESWSCPHACSAHKTYVKDEIIKNAEERVTELPDETMNTVFEHMSPELQQKMQKAVEEKLGVTVESSLTSVVEKALHYHTKFSFLTKCTQSNHSSTATEKHYCANRDYVLQMLRSNSSAITPEMRAMYLNLFKKEQEEVAKGNYVFYHAQRWPWHFKADIYKQFVNLTQPTKVGDDYQFLRFGNNKEHNKNYVKDALFMNGAMFGNATQLGSCSFSYSLRNHDYSNGRDAKFSSQWMAEQFKLQQHYDKHKLEFEELEQLHDKASKHGNSLLISIPRDKVNGWVHTTDWSARVAPIQTKRGRTSKAQKIIDMLKENPEDLYDSDQIEYAMPMEGDVLDPHKGPRMYAFNNADPKIMAEYREKRDQLFATIQQEILQGEKEKATQDKQVYIAFDSAQPTPAAEQTA